MNLLANMATSVAVALLACVAGWFYATKAALLLSFGYQEKVEN